MKIHYTLPLAVAIGLGFGVGAIRGLHARTTTPAVYVVVEIDEITDANGFEALRQTADATAVEVQSEDGRYFARTENVTALDGSAPKFFAFIAFDNMTKAKIFNDSMKNTTALRTRVTQPRCRRRRRVIQLPRASIRGCAKCRSDGCSQGCSQGRSQRCSHRSN